MSQPVLLLVRHGNTFNEGDKVVWCGARTDLKLTEKGEAQAREMGERLGALGVVPARLWHGPLLRTRRHAAVLAQAAGWQVAQETSEVLREIDYGAWEGLSSEEIEALGGKQELEAWDRAAQWPKTPGWTPLPDAILQGVARMMEEAARQAGVSVVVTSNGIMRFFGMRAGMEDKLKVGTGRACVLVHTGGGWQVRQWNAKAEEITL